MTCLLRLCAVTSYEVSTDDHHLCALFSVNARADDASSTCFASLGDSKFGFGVFQCASALGFIEHIQYFVGYCGNKIGERASLA